MAKHIIAENYTFTPSTRTIVINRSLRREQLMLITNVTRNTVLYNFSDPNLGASSYTAVTSTATGQTITTIVLAYNTTSHLSTDKISILAEETVETFQPIDILMDPVNKLRVSQPQALIDTDFEYSTQPTKWESIALLNNRPFAYYNTYSPLTYTDITATNGSRSVTVATTTPPAAGTPIYIQDSNWAGADGLYMIDTIVAGTSFTYTARVPYTQTTGSINNAAVTSIFPGAIFSGASIGAAGTATFTPSNLAVTVVTGVPHGLCVGNEIAITGITGTNPPNGSWVVSTVLNPTTFVFYSTAVASGLTVTSGLVYVRPQGSFLHRSFDGGVTFSTNAASHNHQLIRQTRRYFRYQSGKGIQLSTGTILKPNLNVDYITSSGTTITVTTKIQHNINPGTTIFIAGCDQSAYNGVFTVATVLDTYKFTYTALSTPSTSVATGLYTLTVTGWYGGTIRLGMFDSQNGIFYEFDGQNIYTVKRSSTYQLSGWVSATAGSNTITGITVNGATTAFSKQLQPNDFIVIKGMSYRVLNIASDSSMTVTPSYRGSTNLTQALISKTVDIKTIQSSWNLDRMDGTGVSGYSLDLTKMQMFYMDYSWYGAGFIRWGFRGNNGDVSYCHKTPNNNLNYEAYMRSGNLPARYEVNTFSRYTVLAASMASGDNSFTVLDGTQIPNVAGILCLRNSTQCEYVTYTGVTGNTITGVTRGQAGGTLTATTVTAGSPTVLLTSTTGIQVGQYLSGTGIASGSYVVSFITNTSFVMNQAAVTTGSSVSLTFAPMGQVAQTFTVANPNTSPTLVELHAPQFAATISHWGTSVIMDGRFDDDKSYVFTKGMLTTLSVAAGVNNALLSIRIAPSVSNGITGSTVGSREIINRMQMVMRQMDIFSNGQFLITLVLNGTVSSATPNWSGVGGSSLGQTIQHSASTTVSGGETIFGFFINSAGGTNYSTTQQDLILVRDLGTSILGGGSAAANVGIFPDGPDIITVMAQNIGSAASNIFARLSWTEAQA
jgi:hypothetical protein